LNKKENQMVPFEKKAIQ